MAACICSWPEDERVRGNRKLNGSKGEMEKKGLKTNGTMSAESRTAEAKPQETREP